MFTNITCMSVFDNHSSWVKGGNSITHVTLATVIGNFIETCLEINFVLI